MDPNILELKLSPPMSKKLSPPTVPENQDLWPPLPMVQKMNPNPLEFKLPPPTIHQIQDPWPPPLPSSEHTIAEKQNPNPLGLRLLPPKLNQIRGPRPPPLRLSKNSHKIKKAPPKSSIHIQQKKNSSIYANQPTIIYSCSPRTIHARSASDFKSIFQRLTGSSLASYSGAGDLLPVAGLASLVKTSPSKRDRNSANSSTNKTTAMLEEEKVVPEILRQASTHPGIFSPATSALPPIPDGFFSPAARLAAIVKASPSKRDRDRPSSTNYITTAMLEEEIEVVEILSQASTHTGVLSPPASTLLPIPDVFSSAVIEPQSYLLKRELSPIWHNAFMASTSGLFSASLISPSPSSLDLFNLFYVLNAKTEISEELLKNGDDPAEQQPNRSLFPGIGYSCAFDRGIKSCILFYRTIFRKEFTFINTLFYYNIKKFEFFLIIIVVFLFYIHHHHPSFLLSSR